MARLYEQGKTFREIFGRAIRHPRPALQRALDRLGIARRGRRENRVRRYRKPRAHGNCPRMTVAGRVRRTGLL